MRHSSESGSRMWPPISHVIRSNQECAFDLSAIPWRRVGHSCLSGGGPRSLKLAELTSCHFPSWCQKASSMQKYEHYY